MMALSDLCRTRLRSRSANGHVVFQPGKEMPAGLRSVQISQLAATCQAAACIETIGTQCWVDQGSGNIIRGELDGWPTTGRHRQNYIEGVWHTLDRDNNRASVLTTEYRASSEDARCWLTLEGHIRGAAQLSTSSGRPRAVESYIRAIHEHPETDEQDPTRKQ